MADNGKGLFFLFCLAKQWQLKSSWCGCVNTTVTPEYGVNWSLSKPNFRMLGTFDLAYAWKFCTAADPADSLTCFQLLVHILFSYGSRQVRNIQKISIQNILDLQHVNGWSLASGCKVGSSWFGCAQVLYTLMMSVAGWPFSYRLQGPGAWPGAADALRTAFNQVGTHPWKE